MKNLLAILASIALACASSGCNSTPDISPGATTLLNMTIHDPALDEKVHRRYEVHLPQDYDSSKQYPVVFWFHWWGDDFTDFPYIDNEDVISVYPRGMSDYQKQHNVKGGWASWNNGDGGISTVCTKNTTSYCYLSCDRLNKCGRCNSFTCYDDVFFVRELLKELNSKYCIDNKQVSASGDSAGGMFTYYLSFQAADIIQNFGIVAGHPLVGRIGVAQEEIQGAYVMAMNGRTDQTIPPQGGIDGTGEWISESVLDTFKVFGLSQGCKLNSWTKVVTPWDNFVPHSGIYGKNLDCMEYTKGCSGRVMLCMHDGNHDVIPEYMADLTWWFWNSRNTKQDSLEPTMFIQN